MKHLKEWSIGGGIAAPYLRIDISLTSKNLDLVVQISCNIVDGVC